MVDPKLWPTKTKEGERDWYVEARVGSENYRGQLVHFIRDWHTEDGRQYVNAKAEDVIAQLLEERDAAIRENTAAMAVLREHLSGEYTDLADAVRNLAQAYISERGNAETATREHQRALGEAAEIAQGLQSRLDEAIRERDLARAHDSQPYPTAEAYERVCAALKEAKAEALKWRRIRTPTHGSCCTCQGCGLDYESCRCDLDEACERADRAEADLVVANEATTAAAECGMAWAQRAKKAEALLREIAAVPLVGLTLGSVLLAKIREALAGK